MGGERRVFWLWRGGCEGRGVGVLGLFLGICKTLRLWNGIGNEIRDEREMNGMQCLLYSGLLAAYATLPPPINIMPLASNTSIHKKGKTAHAKTNGRTERSPEMAARCYNGIVPSCRGGGRGDDTCL